MKVVIKFWDDIQLKQNEHKKSTLKMYNIKNISSLDLSQISFIIFDKFVKRL